MKDGITTRSKVYVAGHRGLVGSAIVRALRAWGCEDLILRSHAELDLASQADVRAFFTQERPEAVFVAAAKVGGIAANSSSPADFIQENLAIQTNVIHESWRAGVSRLLFLGSNCIYPRDCPQPIREEYLLSGPLEPTNQAYAIAKIAGIEMCGSYNEQHGTKFACAMPANLFGIGDNYDPRTSHVLPALIRKAYEARRNGRESFTVWGTGSARREFLLSDDLGSACVRLLQLDWQDVLRELPGQRLPIVNIGTGEDISIRDLAAVISKVVGFEGSLAWDPAMPDGTPRKVLDVARIRALGWTVRRTLEEGLAIALEDFVARYAPADVKPVAP